MTSLANSLAGLSLLSGTNLAGLAPAPRIESKAVRLARAQFSLPPVTPVWREAGPKPALSAVMRLPSFIDQANGRGLPPDVATAFTAYKALERLRILAEAGTGVSVSDGVKERFASGLAELEQWLARAPGEDLTLSFGGAARRADSIKLPLAAPTELRGSVVAAQRGLPIAGLSGSERFVLNLARPGASDSVAVDLAGTPQPPTLDTVAAAFNQAITSLPMLAADGSILRDAAGDPVSRYQSRLAVVRSDAGWSLELRSGGIEEVALRDADARPALLVTSGEGTAGQAGPVRLTRFDLPASDLQRTRLAELSATDRQASAVQPLGRDGKPLPPLLAPLSIAAAVTSTDDFTYAVGTSSGDLGSHLGEGSDDLVLLKLDSRGRQVWQRSLGTAGTANGLSIALDPSGAVVVGGTVAPSGDERERDLLVARFGPAGEEQMLSTVRRVGDDTLQGMALAPDGSVVLAARSATGSLSLARVAEDGRLLERHNLEAAAGTQVRGLASGPGGDLLLLTQAGDEAQLRRIGSGPLGDGVVLQRLALTASSLAVSSDGRVAIGGQRGGDGAVALVEGGSVQWASLASAGDDRIDQLLFDGADLLAGGRTSGSLGAARSGKTDAFVARVDAISGAVEAIRQWGEPAATAGPLTLTLAARADSAVHRLGFNDGLLNPAEARTLVEQTALRPGDSFQIRLNGGPARSLSIAADETAASFADRISRAIGRSVGRVTIARVDGAPLLRFEPAAGQRIDLLSGPEGRDALAKLGLAPGALIAPPPFNSKAPRVTPGGHYGLNLAAGLSLGDRGSAKVALERIDGAIATVQAGFRSLYWDETKAALAEGPRRGGSVSPYLAGQLARYQDALNRLGG